METLIKEFVTTKKTEQETNMVAKKLSEYQEKLESCKRSTTAIRANGPIWSSDDVVLRRLNKEAEKLQELIRMHEAQIEIQQHYTPIDLSFLKRRQTVNFLTDFTLPLFSVHKINNTWIENMVVGFYHDPNCNSTRLTVNFGNSRRNEGSGQDIHHSIAINLRDAIGIKQKGEWNENEKGCSFTYKIDRGWGGTSPHMSDIHKSVRSSFVGIVPNETKQEIESARKITEEVYLIKEAAWEEVPVTIDPLVVCVAPAGDAYLIASFDCTPVEYWAKQEHTE